MRRNIGFALVAMTTAFAAAPVVGAAPHHPGTALVINEPWPSQLSHNTKEQQDKLLKLATSKTESSFFDTGGDSSDLESFNQSRTWYRLSLQLVALSLIIGVIYRLIRRR